jgi:predicted nucleotidyltransferase component of viral defense system
LFLHELPDARELFETIAKERKLLPAIIEKDYWLMHCLWGIQQQGFSFELKGGTSLSIGFGIIERFSEDIDIQIHPDKDDKVKIGKNHDKPAHIESRRQFFEKIKNKLKISGFKFNRDTNFDDIEKMRSAGIRAEYSTLFSEVPSLKEGIVLELGFDQTTPYMACDITSWAFEKAQQFNLSIIDNRAKKVNCYCAEYTFVEKLQTISTKYRLQQEKNTMPVNFLRHYYDVYKLLESDRVLKFIGSKEYEYHKQKRFRSGDEQGIRKNEAFTMPKSNVRKLYRDEFKKKSAIYFGKQPEFEEILSRIASYINRV